MKKLTLLIPLLLCSCNNQNNYPFRFEDKYYDDNSKGLIELKSIDEFIAIENNYESFGIYIYLPGCLTCTKFKPILEDFLNINNISLYSISYTSIKKTKNTLYSNIDYAPAVALFNKGDLVTYLDSTKDEHIKCYEDINELTNWFKTYVEL